MKKYKKFIKLIATIVFFVLVIWLIYFFTNNVDNRNQKNNQTQIPNPASVNCIDLGGEIHIRIGGDDDQIGYCIKDGKECEEWALYRGECKL